MQRTNLTKKDLINSIYMQIGFSKNIIKNFFTPFFSGIFLEDELYTSSRMFEFVFKMFGEGLALMPKGGIEEISKNVAMQAAAMNPIALDESGVDQTTIDKEIEIAKDQLRQEGKPEAMLDNIANGKLKRFFKDNTLVNQAFIKDSKQSVAEYVKSTNTDLKVTGFKRVSLV